MLGTDEGVTLHSFIKLEQKKITLKYKPQGYLYDKLYLSAIKVDIYPFNFTNTMQ